MKAHIAITVERAEGDAMPNKVVHWEIGGSDLDALSGFYESLFDWKATSFDADYRLVDLGDGVGGGLMRCRDGMPSYVTIYVAVDDLDDTLAKVKDLGGIPLVPPTPIRGVGAFALFQDPAGNTIGILQPTRSPS
jgi:predicted enzyme related to lactoylglutathione lyase